MAENEWQFISPILGGVEPPPLASPGVLSWRAASLSAPAAELPAETPYPSWGLGSAFRYNVDKLCSPCNHSVPILQHATGSKSQDQSRFRAGKWLYFWTERRQTHGPRGIGGCRISLTIYHRLKWTVWVLQSQEILPVATLPPFPGPGPQSQK